MNKILVITGPTATGKTVLGVHLAEKFNGEIISADSRQVYKYMDIGTGKDIDKSKVKRQKSKLQFKNQKLNNEFYDLGFSRIWGLDLVNPDYRFNVSDFVDYATVVVDDVLSRNKLPIVAGGTGLYIKELFRPSETLHIPPDDRLRGQLNSLSVGELQQELMGINRNRWEGMNESDRQNPRRLVRAIEVCRNSKGGRDARSGVCTINPLVVGLTAPKEILEKRIGERVEKRWPLMSDELKKLKSLKFKSINAFGYRGESLEGWKIEERRYAKRQVSYLEKMIPGINWFDITDKNLFQQVEDMIQNYLDRGDKGDGD